MPSVTLYIKGGDAATIEQAKEKLGDSLSSVFMDCVRERLGRLKLSSAERVILANQFRILEILNPEEREEFVQKREIVEKGYLAHYSELNRWFSPEMPSDESREVIDILN